MESFKNTKEPVNIIAYRFAGYPDEDTQHILMQFCGACRFMWNRFLGDSTDFYAAMGESLNPKPADYKDVEGLEWLNSIDSIALANVQLHFKAAMEAFFDGRSEYPKFKKKGVCKDSYTTNCSNATNPNLRLEGNRLKLPKVKAKIRLNVHRKIKPGGTLKNCTVTREKDGKWYFSLAYEYPKHDVRKSGITDEGFSHIGLDMSLPRLYVDSNGSSPEFEKAFKKYENDIAREQRKLSRMVMGSSNYKKQKLKVARLHAKIKHKRADMLHKISASLTDGYNLISIEDLDIAAMKRSLKLGKSVSDNGWGMFVHMLAYKQERKGHRLVKVDRWFPSSKTCCKCGYVHKELTLSDRTYVCPYCGNAMDRDEQAAINIDKEGLRILTETPAA